MAASRTVEEIGAEIAQVKDELANVKGTECGVYARITGYYRAISGWNNGKREEYNHRKMYKCDEEQLAAGCCEACSCGNEHAPSAHKGKEAI